MKILDVAETYSPHGGGVRTYLHNKLARAAEAGHEAVIVAPGERDGVEDANGGRIVWLASPVLPLDKRYRLFTSKRALEEVIAAEDPDVLEVSAPQLSAYFLSDWRGRAKKSFVFHTDLVAVHLETAFGHRLGWERADRWFAPAWAPLRRLSRGFDVTVCAGHWLRERLEQRGLERVRAVPFGIEKDFFSPSRRDPAVRAALVKEAGAAEGAALVVVLGRLVPEKRSKMLVRAFVRAARQRPMALVVFGGGPAESALRELADRERDGLAAAGSGILVAGHTSDRERVAAGLATADALLHGSAAETYGIAVAEALCSGLPVVAPDRGGAGALVDGACGELYVAGDEAACARALLALLDRDRDELARGCAAARERIRHLDQHFDDLFALYAELVAR